MGTDKKSRLRKLLRQIADADDSKDVKSLSLELEHLLEKRALDRESGREDF